jgi:NAD-dependent deacetylase
VELERVRGLAARADRVVVLTGAGVSAESGVPTFRGGAGAAVWRGLAATDLSSAAMVAENLPLVWEWFEYRRGLVRSCAPNPAHLAIAAWQRRFASLTLVTQNVDGLHTAAGSRDVLELHGNLWRGRCERCGATEALAETPLAELPPRCASCSGPLRPDVVLFGELLPEDVLRRATAAAERADLMFVVGTSAAVYPAAGLPAVAASRGATVVEVNPEPSGIGGPGAVVLAGAAGELLPQI